MYEWSNRINTLFLKINTDNQIIKNQSLLKSPRWNAGAYMEQGKFFMFAPSFSHYKGVNKYIKTNNHMLKKAHFKFQKFILLNLPK